jgi:hypothetical protein
VEQARGLNGHAVDDPGGEDAKPEKKRTISIGVNVTPPFTRTVALLICVMSNQFCQAVCLILPGSLTDFEIGIFLSVCPILCNVISIGQMLTKIRQMAWQNQSDSKNRTNFGCFM